MIRSQYFHAIDLIKDGIKCLKSREWVSMNVKCPNGDTILVKTARGLKSRLIEHGFTAQEAKLACAE
jgi:hypothetical protein